MKTATLPAAFRYPTATAAVAGIEPSRTVDATAYPRPTARIRPVDGSIPGDLAYPAPAGALHLLVDGPLRRRIEAWRDRLPAWLQPASRDPETVAEGALRTLRREIRNARRQQRAVAPVILGEAGRDPYLRGEGLPLLLERLAGPAGDDLPGFDLTLVSRAPRLLWDSARLARLDERHAVTVALPVLPNQPLAVSDAGLLERSRFLAAAGLTVRWLLDPRTVAPSGSPPIIDGTLGRLLDAAAELGVEDVELLDVAGAAENHWTESFPVVRRSLHRLRLQKGFPRGRVGRG